jgi:hypothetical protein
MVEPEYERAVVATDREALLDARGQAQTSAELSSPAEGDRLGVSIGVIE